MTKSMIKKAFILGAGLGTRLQPMTNVLPKPLVPVFNRPLVEHALDHCIEAGIESFAINTHHLHEEWHCAFPENSYRGCSIEFFYEPILLETGGGIKNIESWVGGDSFLIYNGDILTDVDIASLIKVHEASSNEVTLGLRSSGPALHIAIDGNQVIDIHGKLNRAEGTHQFTGLYCANANLLKGIPAEEKISVIPAFLAYAEKGKLGSFLLDQGEWRDLGDRELYMEAHLKVPFSDRVHPSAKIGPSVEIDDVSVIGPNCEISAGSRVEKSVLWPNSCLEANSSLDGCIVFSKKVVNGSHINSDL